MTTNVPRPEATTAAERLHEADSQLLNAVAAYRAAQDRKSSNAAWERVLEQAAECKAAAIAAHMKELQAEWVEGQDPSLVAAHELIRRVEQERDEAQRAFDQVATVLDAGGQLDQLRDRAEQAEQQRDQLQEAAQSAIALARGTAAVPVLRRALQHLEEQQEEGIDA